MDSPYLDGIVMCQRRVVTHPLNDRTPAGMQVVEQRRSSCREVHVNITTIGIDLAKTSFSLAGSDKHGKIVLRKTLSRSKLLAFIANCSPCLIGLEACSGAHYWAREFEKLGHQVRIIPVILTNLDNGLPQLARQMIHDLWLSIQHANEQILGYDRALSQLAREDGTAKRLLSIPGVGEQTATGVVASVPDPRLFKNSRQFAAWLGLVPRQYTTGGHVRLGRITKRGDKYLRMCLVHGARAVIAKLGDKQDHVSCWVRGVIERRGYLRAVVALAARNARLIWTLMVKREDYRAIDV